MRREWSRTPLQHPHSTKKGGKGYDRKKAAKETQHAMS